MSVEICVLMSTYNGEKYLAEQIESILAQKDVNVSLLVRDDASSDKTCELLMDYNRQGKLNWYAGNNLGAARSFWDLIKKAPDSTYYAFSDQDDVWDTDKLISAIHQIKKLNNKKPILYFSNKTLVNKDGKALHKKDEYVRGVTLNYSLLKGFASGCTMVFNKALYNELIKYEPQTMTMHDSWILKVAGAVGTVIYDKTPHIFYRQHGNNTVGNQTRIKQFKRYIKNITYYSHDTMRSDMAWQLLTIYGKQMRPRDRKYCVLLANIRKSFYSRMHLFFSGYLKTQHPADIFFFKIFILLGWL